MPLHTLLPQTKPNWQAKSPWVIRLVTYDFVIRHRKGSLNRKADALSQKAEYRKRLLRNKATIFTKGKDRLIRLYNKTLVTAIKTSLIKTTKEIKEA